MKTTEISQKITNDIVELLEKSFDVKDTNRQINASIHPIIGNSMFRLVNETIENERMNTIIKLSRELGDDTLNDVINILNYKIKLKNEK